MNSILGSLGMGDILKSKSQIELEMRQATLSLPPVVSGGLAAWDAAQAMQDQLNYALAHGSQAGAAQAQQSGWAATNSPHLDPVDDLIRNPFQAASLYFRLRMTRAQLKAKDIEIAFVRQMGGSVHCAIINQNRIITMIDEDVGAFPSDAFIARIRLLL